MSALRSSLLAAAVAALAACSRTPPAPSREVTTAGKAEVTARLSQITGRFMPNDNYDYFFVMKYEVLQVHRGDVPGKTIFVGHYNPLKPRARAADKFVPNVGGNVDSFRVGDVHRMALDAPLGDLYMGGIIDKQLDEKGTRYLALWTERG